MVRTRHITVAVTVVLLTAIILGIAASSTPVLFASSLYYYYTTSPPVKVEVPKPAVTKVKETATEVEYDLSKCILATAVLQLGTLTEIKLESSDKALVLTIPKYTLFKSAGKALTKVSINIKVIKAPPAPPAGAEFVSNVYEISVVGASGVVELTRPVKIEFKIPDVSILGTKRLVIAYYNTTLKTWVPLPTVVDVERGVAYTYTTHLSLYALLAYPQPAGIVKVMLRVNKTEVYAGEVVTVKVFVIGADGKPVPNVVVELQYDTKREYAVTDKNGVATFRIILTEIGVFKLRATAGGVMSNVVTVEVKPVDPILVTKAEVILPAVKVKPGVELPVVIKLYTSEGKPAPNVDVKIIVRSDTGETVYKEAKTDAEGKVEFVLVPESGVSKYVIDVLVKQPDGTFKLVATKTLTVLTPVTGGISLGTILPIVITVVVLVAAFTIVAILRMRRR